MKKTLIMTLALIGLLLAGELEAAAANGAPATPPPTDPAIEKQFLSQLDAPLLFVKRHSYTGIHIYDTYYKWPPGGGGIYILENPAAPRGQWRIRPVMDATTPGTLGNGVYTHPELSWDAKKLLFCYKGEPNGSTSIYEINVDGTGLRQVSDPAPACACYKGSHNGQHDIAPAYLPDGRIVFLSTRASGLVPCNNTGVAILHVMNADGSDMHPISVNNVNEFDPGILPDGRILFGRWEYVDKNALTIQSLWTINPDGTQETALFANNMVFPEAILDARPVPDSHLIVGTLAKHNSTPRGSIAFIDPRIGKNDPKAITNLEHPEEPTFDKGDSCEPWPLSESLVVFSGRPAGQKRNQLEMMDRAGHRLVLMSDPGICLHSPMLVKPRPVPKAMADATNRREKTGRFFVQDIYQGLTGVKRGDIKWLRVIEETSRITGRDGGFQPYNQTFLVSAALAFSVKNFLGVVPVGDDGSVYFEVPSGRAVYFQALDGDGRLVHSMRTFVQAAPGTTRSCIGCHEYKFGTASNESIRRLARPPDRLQPESWGTGYVDFPGMVQPVLDNRCVSCHGGEKGIAAGFDLTGGWTEHFNISYENLANRRETQLVAYWIAGIDCMNGTAHWSCQIFPPRSHGSGGAPLAKLLLDGHGGRIAGLTRAERDLLMAWMDTNGLYHGTWDTTQHGCQLAEWPNIKKSLMANMKRAGCVHCHGTGFEDDWFNLERPELSRILRAPLPPDADGFGLGLCRDRKVDPKWQRVRLLWNGYAHAVKTLDAFPSLPLTPPDMSGAPLVSFASTSDAHYQAMLATIRNGRERALLKPRVDMLGAEILAGACREFNPPPMPDPLPPLQASLGDDGVVQLAWERSARTIGLDVEVHRSDKSGFVPNDDTLVTRTSRACFTDTEASAGRQNYVLVFVRDSQRSRPVCAALDVPPPVPPSAPAGFTAASSSGCVRLRWQSEAGRALSYNVYRSKSGTKQFDKITVEPINAAWFADGTAEPQVEYAYIVRAVSRRGLEGEATVTAVAVARQVKEPVFTASFLKDLHGRFNDGEEITGQVHGGARVGSDGTLDLSRGGYVAFPHYEQFDLSQPLTVELWVTMDAAGQMPIPVSCGLWNQSGWFLQRIGGRWRWHVGGFDCDGGKPVAGQWMHVVCTYDGHVARVYQDGVQVAEKAGIANTMPWAGDLLVGHYSGIPKDPAFQVTGKIAGLKIYHRAVTAAEAAAAARTKPQAPGKVVQVSAN